MNKPIIEVKNLSKSYGSFKAVDDISFTVKKGQLYAFLGVNGAGKSTTIDILSTQLKENQGTVVINGFTLGKDDKGIRKSIGIVFQDGVLDKLLSVKENLKLRGKLYGLNKKQLKKGVNNAMDIVELHEFKNRPYGKLSGGQKRRCDIGRALLNEPDILFLDEPTTGLDPQTRLNLWETIRKLQKENNLTVFLTTHYMEEAAEADYVTIIGDGKILTHGTPQELKMKYSSDKLIIHPLENKEEKIEAILKSQNIEFSNVNNIITVPIESTNSAIGVLDLCRAEIKNFQVLNGTMDEVFISVSCNKEEKCGQ